MKTRTMREEERERGGWAGCIDKSPYIFGLINLPDIVIVNLKIYGKLIRNSLMYNYENFL